MSNISWQSLPDLAAMRQQEMRSAASSWRTWRELRRARRAEQQARQVESSRPLPSEAPRRLPGATVSAVPVEASRAAWSERNEQAVPGDANASRRAGAALSRLETGRTS